MVWRILAGMILTVLSLQLGRGSQSDVALYGPPSSIELMMCTLELVVFDVCWLSL